MLERRREVSTALETRQETSPDSAAESLDAAVDAFWANHARRREPLRSSVAVLAEHALSTQPERAARGTRVLFERVVEPLCDGFTRRGADTYARVFAQVVDAARRSGQCPELDRALSASGVRGERDLLRVPPAPAVRPASRDRVRVVLVPSRMTLGADVAIVLPVLQRMQALFPRARILFIGTQAAAALVRGLSRVEHLPIRYERGDGLAGRLNAWPVLRDRVREVCSGLSEDQYLFVDPDSRLTQLALLRPIATRYCHFPSRSYGAGGTEPLGALVRRWLDETFGVAADGPVPLQLAAGGESRIAGLRAAVGGTRPLVSVSFGVGGNPRKRAGSAFETDLVEWIVARGADVLLARGVDRSEQAETLRLSRRLQARGVPVAQLADGHAPPRSAVPAARVTIWQGDTGAFVAAIAAADMYVGYDSAGQHIAAALGVPTLSVFVESAGPRHALRWTPRGRGPVRVVRTPPSPEPDALLKRTKSAFDALADGADAHPSFNAGGQASEGQR